MEQLWKTWLEFVVLLALGISILYLTIVLPNQEQTEVLASKRNVIQKEVEQLRSKADRLDSQILAVQRDPEFIERRIRQQLHFMRGNERVFESREELPMSGRETLRDEPAPRD